MSASAALMSNEQLARVVPLDSGPRRGGADDRASSDVSGSTSVQKALAVLEAFRGPGSVLGVTEVARRGELSKSTAHRMLALLVEQGYVEREGSRYALGPKLFELGNAASYARARSLRATAMPYMVELLQATHATVHLTVLVQDDLLFLEKVYGHQGARGVPAVGARVPAGGTAAGDAIRAFASPAGVLGPVEDRQCGEAVSRHEAHRLAQVRQRGFAVQDGGLSSSICLAAPVVARTSRTAIAALSVVLRRNQHRSPSLGVELQSCAARIAEVL